LKDKQHKIGRRKFFNKMGTAALGSVFAISEVKAGQGGEKSQNEKTEFPQVPLRVLGKTGIKIPILGFGGTSNLLKNQTILEQSLKYGLFYWDTATNYGGGKTSEQGMGKYLADHPGVRKKLFIISKPVDLETPLPEIPHLEKDLQETLKRLNTDYLEGYCGVHGLSDPAQLTPELKIWVEDVKKRGLIKYFGYSAHKNMAEGMLGAAKCGWIDVILTAYNIQFVNDTKMQKAIDACVKAGIGLIAIKTQRNAMLKPLKIETEQDKKLAQHFLDRGYTEGQAKLKLVLEDDRFTSASVGMRDIGVLTQNVAAALDKTKLSQVDRGVLDDYAQATRHTYCKGCANICESVLPEVPYMSDIMRYLMYYNSYGEYDRARNHFSQIPKEIKEKLLHVDYSFAEAKCPQKLAIGKIVTEAVEKLA
jgi:predicted aldo/keto reductase-like oxidoreductase